MHGAEAGQHGGSQALKPVAAAMRCAQECPALALTVDAAPRERHDSARTAVPTSLRLPGCRRRHDGRRALRSWLPRRDPSPLQFATTHSHRPPAPQLSALRGALRSSSDWLEPQRVRRQKETACPPTSARHVHRVHGRDRATLRDCEAWPRPVSWSLRSRTPRPRHCSIRGAGG